MKKINIRRIARTLVLGLAILCAQSSWAYADGITKDTTKSKIKIQRTNWGNTMGCNYGDSMCVSLWSDNTLVITVQIFMSDNYLSLYPPMHVLHFFPDNLPAIWDVTSEITPSMLIPIILPSGETIWKAEFQFIFDFSLYCENGIYPSFPFRMEYQLVTPYADNVYTPYQVEAYPKLFNPDLFHIPTSGIAEYVKKKKLICCHDETYECSETPEIPYAMVTQTDPSFDALAPAAATQQAHSENGIIILPVAPTTKAIADPSVILAPNPFTDLVKVILPDELTSVELKVFDAVGRHVISLPSIDTANQGNTIDINTQAWPSGVYYFYYYSETASGVLKSIKG